MKPGPKPGPVGARFWSKVNKIGPMSRLGSRCWLWTGARYKNGYGSFKINGKVIGAHRMSYQLTYGVIPPGAIVDHQCHNVICVNPDHLRAVTPSQSAENKSGANVGNISGRRGVSWNPENRNWMARVRQGGRDYHLGSFDDIDEAAAAARDKRLELFTHNDLDREGVR